MQIGQFSVRQIVTNYIGLAITGRSPAVIHAADALKKTNKQE